MTAIFASVDLGGTYIKAALGDSNGHVVTSRSIPTQSHEGPERVLQRIGDLIGEMSQQAGVTVQAVGMAVPGLADLSSGVTRFLPNLPTQWRDVSVRMQLEPVIGCPVYLLNDVRMATFGELCFGHGRTANTMAFFALGTGIGGGVVVDGQLRLGPFGAAGELGHQTILPHGVRCGCGNRGCLETLASAGAIVAEGVRLLRTGLAPRLYAIVEGDDARVTPKEMAVAAEEGDALVREALVRAAEYLGIGLANVVVTVHPDLIVLGGGVAQIGDILFDTVKATLADRVHMIPLDSVQVKPSQLGTLAGTMGGLALAARQGAIGNR